MPQSPPPVIVKVAEKIRNQLSAARRKMAPPNLASFDFVNDLWGFSVVHALAKLEIPDQIQSGIRHAPTIAAKIEADPDHVYRLMRAATNLDVLREHRDGTFSLTPVGASLCKNSPGSLRDYLLFMGDYGLKFWGALPDAIRTGKSSIELLSGKKPFDVFKGDPAMLESFNRAMTAISEFVIDGLISVYPFHPYKKIVDVGGGHGRLLRGILEQSKASTGVLFDLPEVVKGVSAVLNDPAISRRCEIVGGSFFEAVPAGGDLYVMKAILHDWSDRDAALILESIRKVIPSTGRLLLVEMMVPGPNEKHPSKFLDIEMIVHAGGRERTRAQFETLLGHSGFRLDRVIPMAGPTSVIEASPVQKS